MKARDLILIAIAAAVGVLAERAITAVIDRAKQAGGQLDANKIPPPRAMRIDP